jgi:hypothetical protein
MVLRWLVLALWVATTGAAHAELYTAGENGVSLPKLVHRVEAPDPPGLLQAKLEAKAVYIAIVRADGSLDDIRLRFCGSRKRGETVFSKLSPQACQAIDASARVDLASRRYEPAMKDGRAVDVPLQISVEFLYEEEDHE